MTQHFAAIVHRTSKWDNSIPPEQQPGFAGHLEYMGGLEKSGFIVLAGLLTSTNDVLFVFRAESEAEVRERLAMDPWQRDGKVVLTRMEPLALRIGNL
jgi:hypothetical protein